MSDPSHGHRSETALNGRKRLKSGPIWVGWDCTELCSVLECCGMLSIAEWMNEWINEWMDGWMLHVQLIRFHLLEPTQWKCSGIALKLHYLDDLTWLGRDHWWNPFIQQTMDESHAELLWLRRLHRLLRRIDWKLLCPRLPFLLLGRINTSSALARSLKIAAVKDLRWICC